MIEQEERLCVHDPTTWDVEDDTDTLTAVRLCRRCPALTWCTTYTHDLVAAGLPPVLVVQAARVWSHRGRPRRVSPDEVPSSTGARRGLRASDGRFRRQP